MNDVSKKILLLNSPVNILNSLETIQSLQKSFSICVITQSSIMLTTEMLKFLFGSKIQTLSYQLRIQESVFLQATQTEYLNASIVQKQGLRITMVRGWASQSQLILLLSTMDGLKSKANWARVVFFRSFLNMQNNFC